MANSKNNAAMSRFQQEAEEVFSNFGGEEEELYVGDDENFDGDEENYDGDDDQFYTGGPSLDRIDPNDKTLSFTIENTKDAAGDPSVLIAELFGAFKNLYAGANFGNPEGITITLGESSYAQFLAETLSSPLLIKGLRYFVKNEIQLANTMEMVEETSTGSTSIKKYQPGTKIDPRSFKNNILIDGNFTMPVSGRHTLRIPINKGEKVTLICTISTRVDQSKTLEGKAVLEVSKKKKKPGLARRR